MLPNFVDIFFRFVMTKVILLILWEPLLIICSVVLFEVNLAVTFSDILFKINIEFNILILILPLPCRKIRDMD